MYSSHSIYVMGPAPFISSAELSLAQRADDLARLRVERREQRGLAAVERLDLRLLIDAPHQRCTGRVQGEAV